MQTGPKILRCCSHCEPHVDVICIEQTSIYSGIIKIAYAYYLIWSFLIQWTTNACQESLWIMFVFPRLLHYVYIFSTTLIYESLEIRSVKTNEKHFKILCSLWRHLITSALIDGDDWMMINVFIKIFKLSNKYGEKIFYLPFN